MGEIWEYWPRMTEIMISIGVWGVGLLIYTLALKIAIPIETGEMRVYGAPSGSLNEPERQQIPTEGQKMVTETVRAISIDDLPRVS